MNIKIEVIPHAHQRYDTAGDWFFVRTITCPNCLLETRLGELPPPLKCAVCKKSMNGAHFGGALIIRVSELSDRRYEFLVALHELVESVLCEQAGITQAQVDDFDVKWKPRDGIDEPGDDPKAPYENQHNFAMGIEQTIAAALGVKWHEYEKALDNLPKWKAKK